MVMRPVNELMNFYARETIIYLRRNKLEKQLNDLIKRGELPISFLECVLLISKWITIGHKRLPCIIEIDQKLDEITNRVKKLVKHVYLGQADLDMVMQDTSGIEIHLQCINQVLFQEMKFNGKQTTCTIDDFDVFTVIYG
jgi:hypothetical protein